MAARNNPDCIVIGAGLSGLACAVHLERAGRSVLVLEGSDGVGGRMRSDHVDGFILDRGFQVLFTAYPEVKRMLDLPALDLRAFQHATHVQLGDSRYHVADPYVDPLSLLDGMRAPIGTIVDKARLAWLRREVVHGPIDEIWSRPETTTLQRLRDAKFTDQMIERFFRPLFGGIQLDPSLSTSSRMFDFALRMLVEGDSVLPAQGIQAVPNQLAARLAPDTIRLNAPAVSVSEGTVRLASGEELRTGNVVIATEGPAAALLLGAAMPAPKSNPVACVYFAADAAPYDEPVIMLNGDGLGAGPVNNLAVPSRIAPAYAPGGSHLVSIAVVGPPASMPATELVAAVRTQLRHWFGSAVDRWELLRTYAIPHGQPAQLSLAPAQRPVQVAERLYVCGDHRDNASFNGALLSGRRAADAIITA